MGLVTPASAPSPWPGSHLPGVPGAAFAAYGDEPAQMRSGAAGKAGRLRLGFERRGERTVLAELESRAPYLAQRALYCDQALPDLAWLFVITTAGCILQGDRMALEIALAAHARAHVTTQSATKIHTMEANYALQTQVITLGDGAYLEMLPDPLIPHRRARYASDTRIIVSPTATLLVSEIVQPGRRHHHPGECFGMTVLSLATTAARPDGRCLFTEKLLLEPARTPLRQLGVMDEYEVFGNVILCAPRAPSARIHDIVGAGIDRAAGLAYGVCRLPNDCGLVFKVLGRDTATVKTAVRSFWQVVRREVTGADIPAPFFWR
jgi:urease accessory protein